jgi:hypothetical protein
VSREQVLQARFVGAPHAERGVEATPAAPMDGRQAQVRRRGYGTRGKQRVDKLEEDIGSALEASVERVAEGPQGVEGLGRRVHGTPSCSHPSPVSIADADPRLLGLKHKLRSSGTKLP